jgi:hypothetical protein
MIIDNIVYVVLAAGLLSASVWLFVFEPRTAVHDLQSVKPSRRVATNKQRAAPKRPALA